METTTEKKERGAASKKRNIKFADAMFKINLVQDVQERLINENLLCAVKTIQNYFMNQTGS